MAVLLVLLAHVLEATFGRSQVISDLGRAGVLFFFVHTCTVLMFSLERNPKTTAFFVRRFFRIYPLSIVTVLAVILFRLPLTTWPRGVYHVTKMEGLANLLLVQNLFNLPNVQGALWSLPLEVQMYLVLPFLFAFRRVRIEWLWIGSVVVAKLAAIATNHMNQTTLEIFIFVPCFLPGIIAYRHSKWAKRSMPAWLWPVLLLAVTALVLIPKFTAQCVGCLILGLAIPRFREFPTAKIAHFIAKYSYGIYLGHVFAIYLAFTTLSSLPLLGKLAVVLVCTASLSIAGFHAIEDPLIRLGKSLMVRRTPAEETKELVAV